MGLDEHALLDALREAEEERAELRGQRDAVLALHQRPTVILSHGALVLAYEATRRALGVKP